MLSQILSPRPEVAPWAARIAAEAPEFTPEQVRLCRAVFADAPVSPVAVAA